MLIITVKNKQENKQTSPRNTWVGAKGLGVVWGGAQPMRENLVSSVPKRWFIYSWSLKKDWNVGKNIKEHEF